MTTEPQTLAGRLREMVSSNFGPALRNAERADLLRAAELLDALGGADETATSIHRTLVEGETGPRKLWDERDIYNAHVIDIVTRKDGTERRYEGDFLKKVAQIIRKSRALTPPAKGEK